MELDSQIVEVSKASAVSSVQNVQTLWSGYGEIQRYFLVGGEYSSVIVKHIQLPEDKTHPVGWNTPLSHQRKLKSYQVERTWYECFAGNTDSTCKVPNIIHSYEADSSLLLIMEDLDASGYDIRLHHNEVTVNDAKKCLKWLAGFHAKFLNSSAEGLWPIGTYWHLDTRPDEFTRMRNMPLKKAAGAIDNHLNKAKYQTLVHGDAKLANFCFGKNDTVAAVDFQYVGKGCGMKDVAYFVSSCFEEGECERYEEELLSFYFKQLELYLGNHHLFQKLQNEWLELYRYAWADFYRFLDGWSPGHWKMHNYSKRITEEVISELRVL